MCIGCHYIFKLINGYNNLYFVLLVHKVHRNAEQSKYNKYCECRSIGLRGKTRTNENKPCRPNADKNIRSVDIIRIL